MSPVWFWFVVWLLTAAAVSLAVGRAIRIADEEQSDAEARR